MLWVPPWLKVAELEESLAVAEIPGARAHDRIVLYHSFTTLEATSDEIPWCSSFVNFCIATCGTSFGYTRSAAARSWLGYGITLGYPAYGCVSVFKRGGIHEPGPEVRNAPGHVGFFLGFDESGNVRLLAGNQDDRVSIKAFPAERVLGHRWAA